METVSVFNEELAGLYDIKPPISKGKMTAITKAAIRAIKYYKHIVQSVEKFIQKCKTEYKIPGLYVIDSIVRQSRHQYSIEKDVFAPRFAKNILITFFYLFKCPQEDKSKVIRVLNLWQKNRVFGEEIIQPLFDLADPSHPIQKEIGNQIAQKANKIKNQQQQQQPLSHHHTPQQQSQLPVHHTPQQQQTPQYQHTPQHPQTPQHQQQKHSTIQSSNQVTLLPTSASSNSINSSAGLTSSSSIGAAAAPVVSTTGIDQNIFQQIQQMLMKSDDGPVASAVAALGLQGSHHHIPSVSHTHSIPVTHAHSISSVPHTHTIPSVSHSHTHSLPNASAPPSVQAQVAAPIVSVPEVKPLGVIGINQSGDYDGRSLSFLPVDTSQPPPGYLHQGFPPQSGGHSSHGSIMTIAQGHPTSGSSAPEMHYEQSHHLPDVQNLQHHSPREEGEHTDDSEDNKENQDDREVDVRRSRSRSYSRSRRNRRKSRSRSGSRAHHKRSRSRSRGRRDRERDRDKDRRERDRGRNREKEKAELDKEREREKEKEREKERERKKKGLPPIKSNHLSVCSTTLWVGHLSRLVGQDELSDTFGEFGDIVSIDQIPPRGCAFICMNRRQDASRALIKLKNHKLQNKAMTLAWAPGRGVKGKDFKDYWEVELGCSYVPYDKLNTMSHLDLDSLEEGGMIDEDTVPSWMKGRFQNTNATAPIVPNISQPPPTHLPPNLIPIGLPPPSSGTEGLPPMPPLPPPVNKDVRHNMVTPMMPPPFGMHNFPPPGSGGMPIGTSLMAPNLPPMGVPPPMGMPPMPTMLNQAMLRAAPPHGNMSHPPPMVNHNISQESDNMDVEMEDVGNSNSQINNNSSPSQENKEDSNKGNSLDADRENRENENQDTPPNDLRPTRIEDMIPEDFRNDGFNAFNAGRLSVPRPPGFPPSHLGMLHGNGPNFGPRGLPNMSGYNAPRGILNPPHMLGSRPPSLLPDLGTDPRGLGAHGLPGMVRMGLRPMGGPMSNQMLGPMHHRGMPGGPGMMNRFPHSGFPIPRFGILTEALNTMPPLPDLKGERDPCNWNEKPEVGRDPQPFGSDFKEVLSNNFDVTMKSETEEDSKNKVIEELQTKSDTVKDEIPSQHKDLLSIPSVGGSEKIKDDLLEGKRPESTRSWSRFHDIDSDRGRNGDRDRGRDSDRDRDRGVEREFDRGRDRDGGREREFGGRYYNESDRYREEPRVGDRNWVRPSWPGDEKPRWNEDRRDDTSRWGDDRREEKSRWGDDRRDERPRWVDDVREERPRWGEENKGVKRPRDDEVESGPQFDWNSWNSAPTSQAAPKKEKKVAPKGKPNVVPNKAFVSKTNSHNSLVALISRFAGGKKQSDDEDDNTDANNDTKSASGNKDKTDSDSKKESLVTKNKSATVEKSADKANTANSRSNLEKPKQVASDSKPKSVSKEIVTDSKSKPEKSVPNVLIAGANRASRIKFASHQSLVAIISNFANGKKSEGSEDQSENDATNSEKASELKADKTITLPSEAKTSITAVVDSKTSVSSCETKTDMLSAVLDAKSIKPIDMTDPISDDSMDSESQDPKNSTKSSNSTIILGQNTDTVSEVILDKPLSANKNIHNSKIIDKNEDLEKNNLNLEDIKNKDKNEDDMKQRDKETPQLEKSISLNNSKSLEEVADSNFSISDNISTVKATVQNNSESIHEAETAKVSPEVVGPQLSAEGVLPSKELEDNVKCNETCASSVLNLPDSELTDGKKEDSNFKTTEENNPIQPEISNNLLKKHEEDSNSHNKDDSHDKPSFDLEHPMPDNVTQDKKGLYDEMEAKGDLKNEINDLSCQSFGHPLTGPGPGKKLNENEPEDLGELKTSQDSLINSVENNVQADTGECTDKAENSIHPFEKDVGECTKEAIPQTNIDDNSPKTLTSVVIQSGDMDSKAIVEEESAAIASVADIQTLDKSIISDPDKS